jgi:hypothetical protein
VGIGTASPTERLHVAGNIRADTAKTNVLKITPNAGAGKILTSDAAGNASWLVNNAAAAGNIGFGVWGDCATNGNITGFNPVGDDAGTAGDNFGNSVSISGNYAIVGAYLDDVGANVDQGSASIYQYNGNNWVLMQKLTDATGAADDWFGYSVSISGNYAIVGSYNDDIGANTDRGSASVYRYNGSTWALLQKITDAAGAAGDHFGASVSISGAYVIVGAPYDDVGVNPSQGSASIYQFTGASWVLMQKLTDAAGAGDDRFGRSVSISGSLAIVGADGDDIGSNSSQGSANLYRFVIDDWIFMQKLTDPDGVSLDTFGYSVSMSDSYVVVGGHAYASVYKYIGIGWTFMQKITDIGDSDFDFSGTSVSISGDYVVVGIRGDDIGNNSDLGSASIYLRVGNMWGKLQYTRDPMGTGGNFFGSGVAIDGTTKQFLIGAKGCGNDMGKVVFGKVN